MLRIRFDAGGKATVVLGLTQENITRMQAGEPVACDLAELGITGLSIITMAGKDHQDCIEQLRAHGIPMPDMPEPEPGQRVVYDPKQSN